MGDFKIFIDHQYLSIYDGELKSWILNNIINPLQNTDYLLTISESEEQTINLLQSNEYDIVIITGYSSVTLVNIKNSKNTKTIGIIYEMNAEKLLELFDSSFISDIVAHKARLIFLCNSIIVPNNIVKNELNKLYSGYEINLDKIKTLKYNFFTEITDLEKIIKENKYIVLEESINGASFLLDDFTKILNDIEKIEDFPNIKIILLTNNLPQNIYYEIKNRGLLNLFIILKDITEEERKSIYKFAICIVFLSSLDVNIDKINLAYCLNSICLLNILNDTYMDYYDEYGLFYSENDNIINITRDIMRTNKNTKDQIKETQIKNLLDKIENDNNKNIHDIIKNILV